MSAPDKSQRVNPVESVIRARRTSKVLLPVELREEQQSRWTSEHADELQCMLDTAAWAPFHKKVHEHHISADLDSPMPWRFHVLGPEACTRLLSYLEQQAHADTDPKWNRAWQSKIKDMISGCGVLIQATWLPDPIEPGVDASADQAIVEFTHKNIEHVAAASSAVQSLLLAAESRQWLSYWSSGGILRDDDVFDFIGINRSEQLLGSVFLTPQAHARARILEGSLREQRGDQSGWVHWV